ncbi:hypothetical protein JK636_18860 [Clostridium sp. YIM B02515]|uniref:Transposase n=1 Tax=Clostridium rhizosphaerae TaxID=2803861 RepID=A0ABS1TEH5_9CLOT|nr:hypothetical protein [Clostridium rhizosphaerae]
MVEISNLKSDKHDSSANKMFKSALHGKIANHIRQLTESEFRKANIRAM